MVVMENPIEEFPPMYGQLLDSEDEGGCEEEDEMEMNLDLLEGRMRMMTRMPSSLLPSYRDQAAPSVTGLSLLQHRTKSTFVRCASGPQPD
ncbi:hypothetical protein ILYODFUR_003033 [Ilyodon furcidens]|uniref:Uncharacterized protein n=1 Tax=Ilyodon furcidens TaxID=33524 RepID=A0ABV0TGT6_9TELE